jgi:dipeptidyl aminopeptidase/acylaminoacyl peptidase
MKWLGVFLLLLGILGGGYIALSQRHQENTISPIGQLFEKPLEKYTVSRLSMRQSQAGPIALEEPIATTSAYTVHPFYYTTDGKKVTGLAHIPTGASELAQKPVIVQIRGYVEREMFSSGVGTRRSAEVFASNGFISLAPDFLGYGGSDNPSEDVFEERFQTYTATLDLLASISLLPMADKQRIGMWAHSNGGQIALTVLEATGGPYPLTLWAPVTKPFPYSILYYTDEAPDHGKALRKKLADFEENYDVEMYSMVNFLDRISSPMQLHQGTGDEAVPVAWSDAFVALLREQKKDIEYFVYPGSDHNLSPAWNTVVARDIEFFRKGLLN